MVSIDKHIDIIKLAFISFFVSLFGLSILEIRMELIVIYSKIIGVGKFKLLSFLKRILIVTLAIILSFNIVCKPKETKAFALTLGTVATIVACVSGIVWTADMVRNWFIDNKNMNEDEVVDYFNKNVSVDGDGNYTFTDDAQLTINQMLEDYDKAVTMMYRYPYRPDYLEADWFPNKTMYTYFVDMVKKHPEYYFDVFVEADNQTLSFFVYRSDDCLSAVNANFDLIYASCALYNSDWLQNVEGYFMTLNNACTLRVFKNLSSGLSSPSTEFTSFDEAVEKGTKMSFTFPQSSCIRSDNIKWSLPKWNRGNPDYLVSSHEGAINCYKSVADMKKDLGSQVVGKYTSDYTGQPNYNITTSEVNNIVNNYYNDSGGGSGSGGGSSGSDDSGGGSGILDGLGKVFGAIGKVIDKIIGFLLDIIAKIVEGFTKILDLFAGTFTKLIDLVPSGFNDFLSAMFPYIPEDWITLVTASITIFALGTIFWFFRGR